MNSIFKGMKFALVEMKLALVKLLLNFEIHPSKDMPQHVKSIEGIVTTPEHGVKIVLKKRH